MLKLSGTGQRKLKLSGDVNECKPVSPGLERCGGPGGRALHSPPFCLNISAFCELGGVFRGC